MNLFFLDENLLKCAMAHCDQHVVKMILELTQLLYSAWSVLEEKDKKDSSWRQQAPNGGYKLSHQNHPIAKWVRTSIANYNLCAGLALELCNEYEFRYGTDKKTGKKKEHASKQHILWLKDNPPPTLLASPMKEKTQMALAMPDQYKSEDKDPVKSYRKLYIYEKSKFARWKRGRDPPDWFVEGLKEKIENEQKEGNLKQEETTNKTQASSPKISPEKKKKKKISQKKTKKKRKIEEEEEEEEILDEEVKIEEISTKSPKKRSRKNST